MCTCTPTYGLAYPESTDRPCDAVDCMCDFAESVEALLTVNDDILRRTATTVPMAHIYTSVPLVYTVGVSADQFPFDSVRIDTDNMVDFSVNPYGVIINTPGLYSVWFSWQIKTNNVALDQFLTEAEFRFPSGSFDSGSAQLFIESFPLSPINDFDGAAVVPNICVTNDTLLDLHATARSNLQINITGPSNATADIIQMEMNVTWVADLP